ncbi:hypothetical protein M378DRAFT_70780 [Amanita muscaria Koide BX008]|uniref:Uncharacterized protein n=1 Tax=Amanita muscaria (strain Koide BX008) TaxID=946122 RepID=A0A0C2X3S8_AMAMK|nr:hypothetical protein M378DRAFT_70780 [Amanita muscaria Koide BX008]
MPQQTERAIPTKIESLSKAGVGCKLRLAGRMLSYEPITGLALVLDGEEGILVDVTLCVDRYSNSWSRERLCLVMIIGYLETSPVSTGGRPGNPLLTAM